MLRCQPSQLNLTSADVQAFQYRLANRSLEKHHLVKATACLSDGPGRKTAASTVALSPNIDRQRFAKVSHCATTVESSEDKDETSRRDSATSPVSAGAMSPRTTHSIRAKTASALESVLHHPLSPLASLKISTRGTMLGHTQNRHVSPPETRDGDVDRDVPCLSQVVPFAREIDKPAGSPFELPQTTILEGRLLSSERARRPRSHDHEVQLGAGKSPPIVVDISRLSLATPLENTASTRVEQVDSAHQYSERQSLSLDPQAPVFTPRVRFAATIQADSHGSVEFQLHGFAHRAELRPRSSADQNIALDPRATTQSHNEHQMGRVRSTANLSASSTASDPHMHVQPVDRGRSLPSPSRQLERYPILQASNASRNVALEQGLGHTQPPRDSHSTSVIQPLIGEAISRSDPPGASTSSSIFHSSPPVAPVDRHPTSNLLTPTTMVSSQGNRSGSLPWSSEASRADEGSKRIPSMVSAASGISEELNNMPQSFLRPIDATTAFVLNMSSPLDRLVEDLRRLSTSLPPDHDDAARDRASRPWLRRESVEEQSSPIADEQAAYEGPKPHGRKPSTPGSIEKEAISHSSTQSLTSISRNNTSPGEEAHRLEAASIAPELDRVDSHIPQEAMASTPRVRVYDDAKPAHVQPQTPADLCVSVRRGRNTSEPAPPYPVGQAPVSRSHRPSVLERRHYRSTYPSPTVGSRAAIPSARSEATHPATTDAAARAALERTATERSLHQRAAAYRNSDETENEAEVSGHVEDLEYERRMWASRRGGDALDTTPSREGRFERYLD